MQEYVMLAIIQVYVHMYVNIHICVKIRLLDSDRV